jgi:ATP-dependent RNA helicase DDX46/PRP5
MLAIEGKRNHLIVSCHILINSFHRADIAKNLQMVVGKLNQSIKMKTAARHAEADSVLGVEPPNRRRDPDATDFHASIPINDYPQVGF